MESWNEIDVFVREEALELLKTLDNRTQPQWGIMTPVHMVENLTYGFDMSVHNFMPVKTNGKVERNKIFVFENGFPVSERKRKSSDLKPTTNATLQDAIIDLEALIWEFYDVMGDLDDTFKTSHFYFGPLDFDGWRILHFRHMQHHLQQFGLQPLSKGKMEWKWPN